jgi:hypothetical protein
MSTNVAWTNVIDSAWNTAWLPDRCDAIGHFSQARLYRQSREREATTSLRLQIDGAAPPMTHPSGFPAKALLFRSSRMKAGPTLKWPMQLPSVATGEATDIQRENPWLTRAHTLLCLSLG